MNTIWNPPADVPLERHKLSVDDVYTMVEAGILAEDDRVELINGELIELSPKNIRHEHFKNYIVANLSRRLPAAYKCWIETTVRLSETTYVEPDITLIQDEPSREKITGDDALLVIEITDTSLAYDRDIKASLYAAHGIAEYWMIDVNEAKVTVHRAARSGTYQDVRIFSESGSLSMLALPDLSFSLSDLLA